MAAVGHWPQRAEGKMGKRWTLADHGKVAVNPVMLLVSCTHGSISRAFQDFSHSHGSSLDVPPVFQPTSQDTGVQPTGWEGKAAAWLLLPDHQPAPISGWIQQQCGSSHPRAPLLCQGHTGSSKPDVKSSATSGSLFSPRFSLLFWSSSSQRYMQGLPKCSSPT